MILEIPHCVITDWFPLSIDRAVLLQRVEIIELLFKSFPTIDVLQVLSVQVHIICRRTILESLL